MKQHSPKLQFQFSTTILPKMQHFMFSGEQAREDAAQAENQIRTAAFMGLRMMTDQAVHLAKQGSMIPHLYPERQLSVLSEAPTPLGMAGRPHTLARFHQTFLYLEMCDALTAQLHGRVSWMPVDKGMHAFLGLPALSSWCSFQGPCISKNGLHASQHQNFCLDEQVLPLCHSKNTESGCSSCCNKLAIQPYDTLANMPTAGSKAISAEALVSQHVAGAHVAACSQQLLWMRLLMKLKTRKNTPPFGNEKLSTIPGCPGRLLMCVRMYVCKQAGGTCQLFPRGSSASCVKATCQPP